MHNEPQEYGRIAYKGFAITWWTKDFTAYGGSLIGLWPFKIWMYRLRWERDHRSGFGIGWRWLWVSGAYCEFTYKKKHLRAA